MNETDIKYSDEIRMFVDVSLSFVDRVKVLLGWRIQLVVKTLCENVPGRVESLSVIHIRRPWDSRVPQSEGAVHTG